MKYSIFIFLYFTSFFVRYFMKINNNLIVFSARGGMGFEDNPKYLFLYTLKNTNYRSVWITKNKNLLMELKNEGYEVYYYLSKEAFFLSLSARAIFISHSITDAMPIFFNKKTKVINLWHGIPIKKIALLDKNQTLKSKLLYKINKKVITYFISNDESFNHVYKDSFDLYDKQILALGLPRIEYLRFPEQFFKDKAKCNNLFIDNKSYKNYLYAPTFRDYDYNNPLLNKSNLAKLDVFFQEKNIKLYIKLHPQEKETILNKEFRNIYLISCEIYQLLPLFENFISDYSSIIYDFLIAYPKRNLIIYAPDINKYKEERGFFINFDIFFKDFIINNFDDIFTTNNRIKKLKNLNDINSCRLILNSI